MNSINSLKGHIQHMRNALLKSFQKLAQLGLNRGTSGNASVRTPNGFLVTPSGMPVEDLTADSMVEVNLSGQTISAGKPSSEWRFHRDIYQARPEVNAIIHTHAMFSTSLSCMRQDIPPFHYMIAIAGGKDIRCANYALFGTQALSDEAIIALQGRKACLLANHGMIAIGKSLNQAMDITLEVESLCEQYWRTLLIGQPNILSDEEITEVLEKFKDYGNWNK
jgi:L-fuculose-phosphate aldolase